MGCGVRRTGCAGWLGGGRRAGGAVETVRAVRAVETVRAVRAVETVEAVEAVARSSRVGARAGRIDTGCHPSPMQSN